MFLEPTNDHGRVRLMGPFMKLVCPKNGERQSDEIGDEDGSPEGERDEQRGDESDQRNKAVCAVGFDERVSCDRGLIHVVLSKRSNKCFAEDRHTIRAPRIACPMDESREKICRNVSSNGEQNDDDGAGFECVPKAIHEGDLADEKYGDPEDVQQELGGSVSCC